MLKIGYIYRTTLAFVLLSVGTFGVWTGFMIDNLSITFMGYLSGLMGSAVLAYSEMRRITEGLGQ